MRIGLALGGAVAIALSIGFVLGSLATGVGFDRFSFLYDDFTIDSCLEGTLMESAPDTLDALRLLHRACYEKLHLQATLNETLIRRATFQGQHFANAVVMWIVVALTLSGVGLAAYQIVAAARFAPDRAMPESELSVEKGRLFLRSSITGLFILIVSFAFFYVYVMQVYRIREVGGTLQPDGLERLGTGSEIPLAADEPVLDVEGVLLEDEAE